MKKQIFELIKKDLRVYQKKILGFMLFSIGGVLSIIFFTHDGTIAGDFVMKAGLLVSVACTAFFIEELKGNSKILAASLPVTRQAIVSSRYLTSFLVATLNLTLFLLAYNFLVGIFTPELPYILSFKIIAIPLLYILFHLAFSFYAFFKFNYFTALIINVFSLFLPMFFLIKVWRTKDTFQPTFESQDLSIFMITGGITLLLITFSYFITVFHYEKKDL